VDIDLPIDTPVAGAEIAWQSGPVEHRFEGGVAGQLVGVLRLAFVRGEMCAEAIRIIAARNAEIASLRRQNSALRDEIRTASGRTA